VRWTSRIALRRTDRRRIPGPGTTRRTLRDRLHPDVVEVGGHLTRLDETDSLLTTNISRNGYGNVETLRIALSDVEGKARLRMSDLYRGDNSITTPGDLSETVRSMMLARSCTR
jgi:hypothetical protein